jgi:serine/threonine-protein kinase RsbW
MQPPQGPNTRISGRRGNRHRVSTCDAPRPVREWSRQAEAAAVPALRSAVCAFAADAGVEQAVVESLRLAVSEALTNVVEHSYRDRDLSGVVSVTAEVLDECVRVIVADQGMGFAPRLDSPGLGVGLSIIAEVCDDLEMLAGTPSGTEVHMAFSR